MESRRFAFILHPLSLQHIRRHPRFGWTQWMPDAILERIAAWVPPIYLGRSAGQVGTKGKMIEGFLYTLGATPGQLKRHSEEFAYKRLVLASRLAERRGACVMGLGAFTSVVGDAGLSVANRSNIGITNGNSLTAAITLETGLYALRMMGKPDHHSLTAMVIGASGSVGSLCSRLLAKTFREIILVSLEERNLSEVKKQIEFENPGVKVSISLSPDEHLSDCDLVITATSAVGTRVLDISCCKPGAVICDVARPVNVSKQEAEQRPDVLVVECGLLKFPGNFKLGYDLDLPQVELYACLAETIILAIENRSTNFSIGRDIPLANVEEIYRLSKKHGFQLAGLRSFDEPIREETLMKKQELAIQMEDHTALSEEKLTRELAAL